MSRKERSVIETVRNRIEEIVEQACAAETNIFRYGIWTHHILKVIENTAHVKNECVSKI